MSEQVQQMFAAIAPRYDVANDALSLGLHRSWRSTAVRLCQPGRGQAVLDCATGTGDLAFAFKRAVGPQGRVVGTDFCAEMLESAPAKARELGLEVDFRVADAMALPFDSGAFDITSIAFGIRNVDDPSRCLRELARVTRPGGKVLVLEFGQPKGWFGALYRFHARVMMPRIGKALTGHRAAYEYLPRTAAAFPAGERFLEVMRQTEVFEKLTDTPLLFGTAHVYVGIVNGASGLQ